MSTPTRSAGALVEVLDVGCGIARSSSVIHDDVLGLWGVAVDIGLASSRASVAGAGIVHVGACGFQRADTTIRAAGEAVERFALMAGNADPLLHRVPFADRRLSGIDWVTAGRIPAGGGAQDCLPGEIVGMTGKISVPACLVDDPGKPGPVVAEASPSGAAAGASWADAARNALLESVERDAVQAFWALRPALDLLDHDNVLRTVANTRPDGRGLSGALAAPGLRIRCVIIPVGPPGLTVVLALITDRRHGGMVAAGSAVGSDPATAMARAAREGVQVLSLLRGLRRTAGPTWDADPNPYAVVDELNRARFWSERDADRLLDDVLERCRPVTSVVAPSTPGPASLEAVAAALLDADLLPVVVDLTHRLPAPAQRLSWHAVKAVVVGHQALRMDELASFSWCHARLADLAARWKCDSQVNGLPHPLI